MPKNKLFQASALFDAGTGEYELLLHDGLYEDMEGHWYIALNVSTGDENTELVESYCGKTVVGCVLELKKMLTNPDRMNDGNVVPVPQSVLDWLEPEFDYAQRMKVLNRKMSPGTYLAHQGSLLTEDGTPAPRILPGSAGTP